MERSVLSVNIQIVARSEDVTTFERGYAGEKVEKLQRYFDHIHSIEVILERDHERAMAEVILAAGKNQTFVGKEVQGDIVSAIDLVVDKLERQLKKYKGKRQSHRVKAYTPPEPEEEQEETYEDVIEQEF